MTIEKLDRPGELADQIASILRNDLLASGRSDITVEDYEDWGPNLKGDRFILIEFAEMVNGQKQNDGRHPQDQEIVFYVLVSKAQKRAAREVKNIGSALMRKLIDNRWGISSSCIGYPERFSSGPAFFTKGEKGQEYEAYEVRFWQLIKYGDSQWPEQIEGPMEIALAINPDNPDDPNEYQPIEAITAGEDPSTGQPSPINSCQAALTVYEALRGGDTGQILKKRSPADHDYEWGDQADVVPDIGDVSLWFRNQLV